MRFTKLSYQILLVFIAVVILALGVSGWVLTELAQRIVTDNVTQGNQEIALRIAEEVDLELKNIYPVLSLLAESENLQSMNPVRVADELKRYQARFPTLTFMYVADLDGQQITRTDDKSLENVITTYGFQVARDGFELLSDVYLPEDGGGPIVTLYLPITENGNIVGILVADISFFHVQVILDGLMLTREETAVIFAQNGRPVAHSRMAELSDLPALTDLEIITTLVEEPVGILEGYTDELGREVVGVHAPVTELGWGVVIQTPVGQLAAEVAGLRRIMAIGLGGSVALAIIAGWLMANKLAKPIAQLAKATEKVAAGDLSATVDVKASNEIGRLARSFNKMTGSLKGSRDQIEALYEEVKELNVNLEQRIDMATKEIRQQADELRVLYEISQDLVTTLEMEKLLPTIAERITDILQADRCIVFLYDEDADVLRARSAYGYMAERLIDFSYQPGEEIVGQAYDTGETQYVPDLTLLPDFPQRDEVRTVFAVPILSTSTDPLGVLSVSSRQPNAFTVNQQQLLKTMGTQIASAIESARHYRAAEQHSMELATLYEIGKEITSTLDLDAMLQIIADDAVQIVGADRSLILLVDAEKGKLNRSVGHGIPQDQLAAHTFDEFQDGISGWVLQNKKPTLSVDIRTDSRNKRKALSSAKKYGDRSAIVAPLLIGDEVIGTLTVVNGPQKKKFTHANLNLVNMLAGQAAIAIQDARLYAAAQEADRLKSAFLASMSHELRTPLNSIIGFTGILLQGLVGPLNEEQTKQLGMIRDSSHHLLNLINDVLDISKIEAGQLEVASELFDIQITVEKAIQTVRPMAEKKNLKLSSKIAPEVGKLVSDQRRVEQILINLVNNAVKFTDQGWVRVECQITEPWLITRVIDTGMGIKPENMGRLFEAFQQIDMGTNRRYEGTGLGLSICQRLVELLGGEIWAESEWGVGSTFTFTLPTGRSEK